MDYISAADIQRACGGKLPPVPEDHDRRLMFFLWITTQLRAAGLEEQLNNAEIWNCWPLDWMHEADRDLAALNTRCRHLDWPCGLEGLKHKIAHPGDWPH